MTEAGSAARRGNQPTINDPAKSASFVGAALSVMIRVSGATVLIYRQATNGAMPGRLKLGTITVGSRSTAATASKVSPSIPINSVSALGSDYDCVRADWGIFSSATIRKMEIRTPLTRNSAGKPTPTIWSIISQEYHWPITDTANYFTAPPMGCIYPLRRVSTEG